MQISQREVEVFELPIPLLLGICFDCTSSISESDFRTAKNQLIRFILDVHKRAHLLPNLPSDFISLTAFKDKNNIFGPPAPLSIVKMDQPAHVAALCQWVNNLRRDGRSTALYDAITIASLELLGLDKQLPYRYLKAVLAITDGGDNDSRANLNNLSYFNETSLCLAVIGVGNSTSSELRTLSRYAISTHSISRFDDLYRAITVSMRVVIERQRYISF